jgi:hypothetical protein
MNRQRLIDDRWRLLRNPGEYQVVPDDAPDGSPLGMIRCPGNLEEDARHDSMLSAAPDGPSHKARAGPVLGLRLGFHADRPTDSDNPRRVGDCCPLGLSEQPRDLTQIKN